MRTIIFILGLFMVNLGNAQLHLNNTYSLGVGYSDQVLTENISGSKYQFIFTKNKQFSDWLIEFNYSDLELFGERIDYNTLNSTASINRVKLKVGYDRYIISFQIYKKIGLAFWGKGALFGGYQQYNSNFNDRALTLKRENDYVYGLYLGLVPELTINERLSILFETGKEISLDQKTGLIRDFYTLGLRWYIFDFLN